MAERRVCDADTLRDGRAHTAVASAQTTLPVSVSKNNCHYYYPPPRPGSAAQTATLPTKNQLCAADKAA